MARTELDESQLNLQDNTTGNVTTARHGFVPKAPNTGTQFLRDDATWATPTGSSGTATPLDVAASTTTTISANTQMFYHIPLTVEGILHIDGALIGLVDKVEGVIDADQISGSYTFGLSDAGTVVEGIDATAQTFTVPPHSSVAFPLGSVIEVFQSGAGQITIAAGAGVTLVSDEAKVKTAAQYATIGLRQRVQNTWVLSGDLGA